MSDDTQAAIAESLADRAARRREQLGIGKPTAQPVEIKAEERKAQCHCGSEFTQQVLKGDRGREILMPAECGPCREKTTGRRIASTGVAKSEREESQMELSLKARWAALEVPPYWVNATLDSFEHHGTKDDRKIQMRVLSWSRRYLEQWPQVDAFTVLRGAPGTGKGHVIWSIAKQLVEQGASAKVVKLPSLVRQLRDTWRKDSGSTYEEVLSRFTDPDFLVIDEASRHAFYGQQIHQHLYDVVDTRIELCRPTLLTTNEDEVGLEEVLRPALFNRLQGEGGIVPFGTASWRSRSSTEGTKRGES